MEHLDFLKCHLADSEGFHKATLMLTRDQLRVHPDRYSITLNTVPPQRTTSAALPVDHVGVYKSWVEAQLRSRRLYNVNKAIEVDGLVIDADAKSRSAMEAKLREITELGGSDPAWRDAANVWHDLPDLAAFLRRALALCSARATAELRAHDQRLAALAGATTLAEVDAILAGAGVPPPQ
jgi:hypothetical protein